MVVRTHRNVHSVHTVGNAVVKAVANDIEIVSADGVLNERFCFARAESRTYRRNNESVLLGLSPLGQVLVHLSRKVVATGHTDYSEFTVDLVSH